MGGPRLAGTGIPLRHALLFGALISPTDPTAVLGIMKSERRETRGCHNRSDYPAIDESLQTNLVWSGPGRIDREAIPPIPDEIATLMRNVSTAGKLVE